VPTAERNHSGTVVAAIIFAAMIAGILYRYWPSDERSIRRHLSNLSEALSIPTTDSDAERITRFAALEEYFSTDVRRSSASCANGNRRPAGWPSNSWT
jgi:hypothetical protein